MKASQEPNGKEHGSEPRADGREHQSQSRVNGRKRKGKIRQAQNWTRINK